MKLLLVCFLLLFPLFFISCTEESPLSDVELNDPSIIKLVITISKSIGSSSIDYNNSVWLYDKNNNSIELKNGSVKMNGVGMKLKRGLNHEPYYAIDPFDELPYTVNTNYECKIILSDGKVYTNSVKSRSTELYRLDAPSDHNRVQDIILSWANPANDNKLVLTMVLYGKNDSANTVSVSSFNISDPASGTFTVSRNYFNNNPGINKVQFTLEAITTGTVSSLFMSGSKITSSASITRYVNLY